MPAAPPAVLDPPGAPSAAGLSAASPDDSTPAGVTALDELLDLVAGNLTPEGRRRVGAFAMTRAQSRRLGVLDRKREVSALTDSEQTEHYDLRAAAEFGGLLKARLIRRRDAAARPAV